MGQQQDDMARLTEAVIGLEQAVTGMAVVLEQQGRMLQRLLEASVAVPEEDTRLHEIILRLIGRLDTYAGAMERVEEGLGRIRAAAERAD